MLADPLLPACVYNQKTADGAGDDALFALLFSQVLVRAIRCIGNLVAKPGHVMHPSSKLGFGATVN